MLVPEAYFGLVKPLAAGGYWCRLHEGRLNLLALTGQKWKTPITTAMPIETTRVRHVEGPPFIMRDGAQNGCVAGEVRLRSIAGAVP